MESESYKAYKETVARVESIIRYEDDMRKIFSAQGTQKLRAVLTFISGQMEMIFSGLAPAVSERELSLVTEVMNFFSVIAAEKPITPIFKDLSQTFLLLIFNWNAATVGDKNIERNIKLVDAIVSSQMTMMETIELLQKLIEKAKKANQYEPPAFNLSRAYLDNLKKAIEEKKV